MILSLDENVEEAVVRAGGFMSASYTRLRFSGETYYVLSDNEGLVIFAA